MPDISADEARQLALLPTRARVLMEFLAWRRLPLPIGVLRALHSCFYADIDDEISETEIEKQLRAHMPLLKSVSRATAVELKNVAIRRELLISFCRSPRSALVRSRMVGAIAKAPSWQYFERAPAHDALSRIHLLLGGWKQDAILDIPDDAAFDYYRTLGFDNFLAFGPRAALFDLSMRARHFFMGGNVDWVADIARVGHALAAEPDIETKRLLVVAAWLIGERAPIEALDPADVAVGGAKLLDATLAGAPPETVLQHADYEIRGKRVFVHGPPLISLLVRIALYVSGEFRAVSQDLVQLAKRGQEVPGEREFLKYHEADRVGKPYEPPHVAHYAGEAIFYPLTAMCVALFSRFSNVPVSGAAMAMLQATLREFKRRGLAGYVGLIETTLQGKGPALWRRPQPAWQRLIETLTELAHAPGSTQAQADPNTRLRVLVHGLIGDAAVHIDFLEQKRTAKGYTQGRRIRDANDARGVIQRLAPDQDAARRVLTRLAAPNAAFNGSVLYAGSPVFGELAHLTEIYASDGERRVTVQSVAPELKVTRNDDGSLVATLRPEPDIAADALLRFENDVLSVVRFRDAHRRVAQLLKQQETLPAEFLPALIAIAPGLADTLSVATSGGSRIDADPALHMLLDRIADGLRFRLRVRPLGDAGPYLVPGIGAVEMIGVRDGMAISGERNLQAERSSCAELLDAFPALAGSATSNGIDVAEPEAALETLSELVEKRPDLPLAWGQGKALRMAARGTRQFKLKVKAQRDWFEASGGLDLDDGEVVTLAKLLEALPSAQGRFLRLSDDRIIALSRDLQKRLWNLRALADAKGRVTVAPVAAGVLANLVEDSAQLDKGFREQLKRMQQAQALDVKLPNHFSAELRDYQRDGYAWLMRLAHWNAGACLADDMGLGKTIQALAVLTARAPLGAALVVAPTSVVANWRQEARRFAPTLNIIVFGDGDRSEALKSLGPGQLLLISYGLMALNIDALENVAFATLVLDEAQAVKNAAAQRSQAARRLRAEARIATTGTPIENHLGELWSLMRILNPGLLGSQEHFQKRFVDAIERQPRGVERDVLRQLISPFLLRRLKSEVLDELPPRTEIVLSIEPTREEAELLAAVRRSALERLNSGGEGDEARRFHVLAELTRLRRAACHPALIAPEFRLPSAKLTELIRLCHELKENRHRALVFSQFTDFLALVRKAFDENAISYQYLDGATAPKAREAAVDAFQGGAGDVFLLSLKAGGVGLNLTAADYVIHLDPWWNPAVEQQATDRAHRIGQTRPVTVYKLVVKGSIEEQILALHGSKRELADSVLGEQDVAKSYSVDELVALLGSASP